MDADSPEQYFAYLDRLPIGARLDAAQLERAKKYAYHFFFRRMIPLEFTEPQPGWPPYRVALPDLRALQPGTSPGLDVVCEGILKGSAFVYPAESSSTAQV